MVRGFRRSAPGADGLLQEPQRRPTAIAFERADPVVVNVINIATSTGTFGDVPILRHHDITCETVGDNLSVDFVRQESSDDAGVSSVMFIFDNWLVV